MKSTLLRGTSRRWLPLLLLAPLACKGVAIDTPASSRAKGGGATAGGSSGSGANAATGGSGGTSMTDGPPAAAPPTNTAVADCQGDELPGPRRLRLLTRQEYANSLGDLLFIQPPPTDNLPVESVVDGFDNNARAAAVTGRHVDTFLSMAETVVGPALAQNRGRLVTCDGTGDCNKTFLNAFGLRAFRRPLSDDEVTRYLGLFDPAVTGGTFDKGAELAIRAMLSSPNFLYRSEMGTMAADGTYHLTGYEVASALSYFLWGSTPDDQLLEAARTGALDQTAGVAQQAQRLLDDPRSHPAVAEFFRQWLGTDGFLYTNKDTAIFPTFSDAVREAMVAEEDGFIDHVVFESTGKLDELFTANYVFVNQPLAAFYGLPGGGTTVAQQPATGGGPRGGLLTLGTVLGSYAHSNDTSPVKRGAFVRGRLLCQTLPPPPPNVDVTPPGLDPTLTTRARFSKHSQDAACAVCHKLIDSIGFAFERYDGVGAYRTMDGTQSIDTNGSILGIEDLQADTNATFDGPQGLAALLVKSPNAQACFARQLFRYARGGENGASDGCAINHLQAAFKDGGFDMRKLLLEVVQQKSFLTRS